MVRRNAFLADMSKLAKQVEVYIEPEEKSQVVGLPHVMQLGGFVMANPYSRICGVVLEWVVEPCRRVFWLEELKPSMSLSKTEEQFVCEPHGSVLDSMRSRIEFRRVVELDKAYGCVGLTRRVESLREV
ncbi:hypothetical protein F2Q68_00040001 [Brassica cretica]|uniref:Uncharacterized protein n=1 Tax=Brassica cretica TaxID=69181 RepID=A0A8S9MJ39_BRACR|nr:hypothetical protein F2Q68_00040001 [Brassica cretica]